MAQEHLLLAGQAAGGALHPLCKLPRRGGVDHRGGDGGMAQDPGELGLGERGPAALGDPGEALADAELVGGGQQRRPTQITGWRVHVLRERAGGERRTGEKREALLDAQLRVLPFERARVEQGEGGLDRLQDGERGLLGDGVRGGDPPGGEAGGTETQDAALAHERPERLEQTLDRPEVLAPLDLEQVEVFGIQTLERSLAVRADADGEVGGGAQARAEEDPPGEDEPAPALGILRQPVADEVLARSGEERRVLGIAASHGAGFDEVAALRTVEVEDGGGFGRAGAPAETGGAERERGDGEVGATEETVVHGGEVVAATPGGGADGTEGWCAGALDGAGRRIAGIRRGGTRRRFSGRRWRGARVGPVR